MVLYLVRPWVLLLATEASFCQCLALKSQLKNFDPHSQGRSSSSFPSQGSDYANLQIGHPQFLAIRSPSHRLSTLVGTHFELCWALALVGLFLPLPLLPPLPLQGGLRTYNFDSPGFHGSSVSKLTLLALLVPS